MRIIVLILLLSGFSLILIPQSMGQSYVTTTLTTMVGSTSYYVYPSATTQATASYTLSSSFTLEKASKVANYGCYAEADPFTAAKGETFSVQFTSDTFVDFYIMTEAQNRTFWGTSCNEKSDGLVAQQSVMSYSLDWVAPSYGSYFLVFCNCANEKTASIVYSLAHQISYQSIVYATDTRYLTVPIFITSASLFTPFLSSSSIGGAPNIIWVGLVGIGMILAVIAIRSKSARRASRSTATRVYDVPETEIGEFCVNCGSRLPAGSSFCRQCGTRQPDKEGGWGQVKRAVRL